MCLSLVSILRMFHHQRRTLKMRPTVATSDNVSVWDKYVAGTTVCRDVLVVELR